MRIGFLGLGTMGTPMALNLAQRFDTMVWNRSSSKYSAFLQRGIKNGETPSQVVEQCDVIFMMLFNEAAIDSIVDDAFMNALRGKTLVNTSSVSVEYSQHLADQVRHAGGEFIEMPVSGSKIPAEQGKLVGMMAGNPTVAERIKPLVDPITSAAVYCGDIGLGLKTKYAVNLYVITMTVGLAESMKLAQAQGVNLEVLGDVLGAGPMASTYSSLKIAKIIKGDWSPQAAVKDCFNSAQLILSAAQAENTQLPLIQLCGSLYRGAIETGLGEEDMITIFKVVGAK